jgi:3-oxoacyl-[acyl-carrier protein] reductase
MDIGLKGKTAWVSGATQGLGRAIADGLAAEGVDLFITARDETRLRQTAEQITTSYRVRCEWRSTDYRIAGEATSAASAALEVFGRVDVLVNNAGTSISGSLDTTPEEWASSNQLNFLSHLEAIRAVIPSMRTHSFGRIINISGFAYRQPREINTGTIAKYGLINTAKVLSRELAPHGVTVNSVAVGLFETPQVTDGMLKTDEARLAVTRQIPMGRLGRPDEIVPAVLFLASSPATYVTGSIVTVDGGADISI